MSYGVRRSTPKELHMPRLFSDNVKVLPKDRVGYLDNALKRRAKAPKLPLIGVPRALYYKVVIRKRFWVQTSVLLMQGRRIPKPQQRSRHSKTCHCRWVAYRRGKP